MRKFLGVVIVGVILFSGYAFAEEITKVYELQPGGSTVKLTTSTSVILTLEEMLFQKRSKEADRTSAVVNQAEGYANADATIAVFDEDIADLAAVLATMNIPE